jgi:hypothetical protein
VKGKVSHVFLLVSSPDQTYTGPTQFRFITTPYIDQLIRGGAGAGSFGGGGPMMMPGRGGEAPPVGEGGPTPGGPGGEGGIMAGPAPAGPAWIPVSPPGIGQGPGQTSALPGGAPFGPGGPGGAPFGPVSGGIPGGRGTPDGGEGGPGGLPFGPGGAGPFGPGGPGGAPFGPGGTGVILPKKPKVRTEFVVCFVWREPTPTDPTPGAADVLAAPAPTGGP